MYNQKHCIESVYGTYTWSSSSLPSTRSYCFFFIFYFLLSYPFHLVKWWLFILYRTSLWKWPDSKWVFLFKLHLSSTKWAKLWSFCGKSIFFILNAFKTTNQFWAGVWFRWFQIVVFEKLLFYVVNVGATLLILFRMITQKIVCLSQFIFFPLLFYNENQGGI